MDVLVFKTNVTDMHQVSRVKSLLTLFPTIKQWNFDLEDCDNILRIVAGNLSPRNVELTLKQAGIVCEQLL